MSKVFEVQQQEVFDAFEDLFAFGLQRDVRDFTFGQNLEWPAAIDNAGVRLASLSQSSLTRAAKAVLHIHFTEGANTAIEFESGTGRITVIHRAVGEISLLQMVTGPVKKLWLPQSRPNGGDYEVLTRELTHGKDYFETLHNG